LSHLTRHKVVPLAERVCAR